MKNLLRREFLKGLIGLPFLGLFGIGHRRPVLNELNENKISYLNDIGITNLSSLNKSLVKSNKIGNDTIRVGLIGYGWRGTDLMRAIGFANPEWTEYNTRNNKYSQKLISYLNQDDLNVQFTGVCDTFSLRAEEAVTASLNEIKPGKPNLKPAKIFPNYREMIHSSDIDAVIIAAPDHWHAQMAIDAIKAGKHVYLEKPMTRTIQEAVNLRKAVNESNIVFQLGHQNRQQMSYCIAKELFEKDVLGKLSIVETYMNRNTDHGAWIREIDKRADKNNINWKEFLGNAPWHSFNPDRYFNWQRWFDYSSGVAGNNFTHHFDCVNQIVGMGIPELVSGVGANYHYNDSRDICDVLNFVLQYPEEGFHLSYAGTLKNSRFRNICFMGSDASMEVGGELHVFKDKKSTKYRKIKLDHQKPFYTFIPDKRVDAITSATALEYIKGGYGKTLVDNQIVDTTYLHLKEWIDAIRGFGKPSCDINIGFEESVSYILANMAMRTNTTVRWSEVKKQMKMS